MATNVREAVAIMQVCETDLSRAFFSEKNVDAIQRALASTVKAKTGHQIDRQSDRELLGIMRGIYEAYSNNTGGCGELKRLNDIVLDIIVDQVTSGVEGYLSYLKDASTMPEPLSRGTFASIKGERTLEYKVGFSS
jgi:hypothetical protein